VQLLLEKGADVNAKDKRGEPVLIQAVSSWANARFSVEALFSPLVQAMITRGADVNAKDADGKTVLMRAEKKPKIIRLLKKHGAKV
jgi:ankyrin repeat protein